MSLWNALCALASLPGEAAKAATSDKKKSSGGRSSGDSDPTSSGMPPQSDNWGGHERKPAQGHLVTTDLSLTCFSPDRPDFRAFSVF